MDTAFSATKVPEAAPVAPQSRPITLRPVVPTAQRVIRDARGNDISARYTQARPEQPDDLPPEGYVEGEESDYVDRDYIKQEAAELAASIQGSFSIGIEPEAQSVKLGSLGNLRDAMTKHAAAGDKMLKAAPKPRRSKKA